MLKANINLITLRLLHKEYLHSLISRQVQQIFFNAAFKFYYLFAEKIASSLNKDWEIPAPAGFVEFNDKRIITRGMIVGVRIIFL